MSENTSTDPPFVEMALIGSVMRQPALLDDSNTLPEHFTNERAAVLWGALGDLRRAGQPIEPWSVCKRLDELGALEFVHGGQFVRACWDSVATSTGFTQYDRQIRESGEVRRAVIGCRLIAERHGRNEFSTRSEVEAAIISLVETFESNKEPGERFKFQTLAELRATVKPVEWIVRGVVAKGQPGGIFAAQKTLKTTIAAELCVSVSTGQPFLNYFPIDRQMRCGLMSAESGAATLLETITRISRSKGIDDEQARNLVVCDDVPMLENAIDLFELERRIKRDKLELLILDPVYKMMGSAGDDAGNLFKMGRLLFPLGAMGQRHGCTIKVVHHNKKSVADPFQPAELSDISWSGFAEFCRQWILISRRAKYEADGRHQLWFNVGGSAGFSCLKGLDINEGLITDPGGRVWKVDVLTADEVRGNITSDQERRQESKRDRRRSGDRGAVYAELSQHPAGLTRTQLKERTGINTARLGPVLSDMEHDAEIETTNIPSGNGQKYPGIKLTRTPGQIHPDKLSGWDSTHTRTRPLEGACPSPGVCAPHDPSHSDKTKLSGCSTEESAA